MKFSNRALITVCVLPTPPCPHTCSGFMVGRLSDLNISSSGARVAASWAGKLKNGGRDEPLLLPHTACHSSG